MKPVLIICCDTFLHTMHWALFFLPQGKEKPYLIRLCTDSSHIFYFSFLKLIIFFIYKRKIIVGLPNIKTIIIVEDQDINETLGFGFYQHASNQNFNLAFSKKALEWYQGIFPNRKHYISD